MTEHETKAGESGWSAVRCVFRHLDLDGVYEERITVWRSENLDEAMRMAEEEAELYANDVAAEYLGLAQGFRLFDDMESGSEAFSLLRRSELDSDSYIERHFSTGGEFQATD